MKDLQDSDFFFLKDGNNVLIVMSQPYKHMSHFMICNDGITRKLNCSLLSDCPCCLRGDRPKAKWFLKVFDVSEKKTKILDASESIVAGLFKVKNSLEDYPINIHRQFETGASGKNFIKYDVSVIDKKLSSRDKAYVKQSDNPNYDMEKISAPRSSAEIMQRL